MQQRAVLGTQAGSLLNWAHDARLVVRQHQADQRCRLPTQKITQMFEVGPARAFNTNCICARCCSPYRVVFGGACQHPSCTAQTMDRQGVRLGAARREDHLRRRSAEGLCDRFPGILQRAPGLSAGCMDGGGVSGEIHRGKRRGTGIRPERLSRVCVEIYHLSVIILRRAQPLIKQATCLPLRQKHAGHASILVLTRRFLCLYLGFASGEPCRIWGNPSAPNQLGRSIQACEAVHAGSYDLINVRALPRCGPGRTKNQCLR